VQQHSPEYIRLSIQIMANDVILEMQNANRTLDGESELDDRSPNVDDVLLNVPESGKTFVHFLFIY